MQVSRPTGLFDILIFGDSLEASKRKHPFSLLRLIKHKHLRLTESK